MIIESYKPIGQTTVEHINEYKQKNNIKKICFAGRLDPLAHGKIYILTDNDVFKKEEYCNKNKIYEAWIIKGFTTDSYDIMGIPTLSFKEGQIIPTKFNQKYPPYSSVMIKKYQKPYWLVTKLNLKMEESDIPTKEVEILNFESLESKLIDNNELLETVRDRINRVNRSQQFRQQEILEKWEIILQTYNSKINMEKIRVKCSSGTYIRNIGNMLNGCCLDIHRISYLIE